MQGESCVVVGYDEDKLTVDIFNEMGMGDGEYVTISYEQYLEDFGILHNEH